MKFDFASGVVKKPKPKPLKILLNVHERDNIKAALLLWQRNKGIPHELYDVAAENGSPLSSDQIDQLIQKLHV